MWGPYDSPKVFYSSRRSKGRIPLDKGTSLSTPEAF